ncbi:MAG: STAS domain-containing protein [Candidatus Manganitrophaceae bacterium]|nr:MAG: STAS domain-containing protein [Candidatus Manganitrophaceae bacterium]
MEPSMKGQKFPDILRKRKSEILEGWMKRQLSLAGKGTTPDELRKQCVEFLDLLENLMQNGGSLDPNDPKARPIIEFLKELSKDRVLKGFSPTETATFVFSLKEVVLPLLQPLAKNEETFTHEVMPLSILLDQLGLLTFENYIENREEVIARQQLDMAELSTPVVKIWDGILALPLIGTLDSQRTMIVMEKLLQKIVDTAATVAILDITGVPTVDTLVANHIMKTVAATRLLGAEVIITGVSPAIAQTIVHLGVDLSGIMTRATMAEGLKLAIRMTKQQTADERRDGINPLEKGIAAMQPAKGQKGPR